MDLPSPGSLGGSSRRGSKSRSSSVSSSYLFGSPASTPALPPQYARLTTVDENRFQLARYRKLVGHGAAVGAADAAASEEYTFVQLADTQLGLLPAMRAVQWLRHLRSLISYATCGLKDGRRLIPIPRLGTDNEDMDDDTLLEIEIDLARKAVQAINAMQPKPRFAVICGDLVHAYPEKQPELNASQVQMFKEIFSQVDKEITLVCACGNHDLGDRPTPGSIALWQKRFGDDYFSFWIGHDKYIVLNSQLYKDSSQARAQAQAQDRWLDSELFGDDQKQRRHTTVFSHIPPFIDSPNEPSGYFPLAKPVRLNLLERMSQAGVKHWFCGHYHRNAGGTYKNVEVITTGAVGANIATDPKGDRLGLSGMGEITGAEDLSGFRIVRVSSEGISHKYKTLSELLVGAPPLSSTSKPAEATRRASVPASPLRSKLAELTKN